MMVQAGSNDGLINEELENEINTYAANNKPAATINKINAIMEARVNLGHNAAPLLTVEALMCVLARQWLKQPAFTPKTEQPSW